MSKLSNGAPHRIYFSVSSEGYGHSSREMAIAEILANSGAKVLFGSSGYVLDRLKKSFDAVEIEKEMEMIGDNGCFDIKKNLLHNKSQAIKFFKIISGEEKIIRNFNATCVVADGRWGVTLSAYKAGVPCVIVANQTQIEQFFAKGVLLRIVGNSLDMMLRTGAALAKTILIPDLPAPYTVCAKTLSKSMSVKRKQRFIGPVISQNILRGERNGESKSKSKAGKISKFAKIAGTIGAGFLNAKRPFILTTLGGHAYRLPIFNGILNIAEKFPHASFIIFTKFKSESIPKNVRVFEFADDISPYMRAADLIITQAGHSTAMEIIALGKPALIIPDKGQIEQECNASRMKELGVAETLDYVHLEPHFLFEKIDMLLHDSKYKENAKIYSKMAQKMNGAKKAAEIILGYSGMVSMIGKR